MLYKFKAKNTGDVILLEATAKRLLGIIGKDASPQGILLCQDIPAAIAALRLAVAQEEIEEKEEKEKAQQEPIPDQDNAASDHATAQDPVRLRLRVPPFLDMLERSHRHGDSVVWGQ